MSAGAGAESLISAGEENAKAVISAEILPADLVDKLAERTRSKEREGIVAPSFVVDPSWPRPLPDQWIIGQVGGIGVDHDDNIWVLHRPRSLSATAAGALGVAGKNQAGVAVDGLGNPRPFGEPPASCCVPAPSVLKFDPTGTLLDSWGGPSDPGFLQHRCQAERGCVWPAREHGIYVDHNNFVYLSGNGEGANGQFPWSGTHGTDSHVLKFSASGEFIYQIGFAGTSAPSNEDINGGVNGTPQPFMPSDMSVDAKTNRLYIADGYGNSRILIVNAETGRYIGHFGAYGQNPVTVEPEGAAPWTVNYRAAKTQPLYFRSPVHCAIVSRDGFLYACDRNNNRIQVFDLNEVGSPCINPEARPGVCGFVRDIPVVPQTIGQTAGSAGFSADESQSCLYAADLWNGMFHVIDRSTGTIVANVGRTGRQLGEFNWLHSLAVDSAGNVYTGEVETGQRVQKFTRYGANRCGIVEK
jgi:DNA-binding beta-propeller fold protein YncE